MMAAKLNPELNVGDEVILLYMTDESRMRGGLNGTVVSVNNTPWGPQYSVKWENGSTLDLIPGADKWMLKSELYKKKITEEIDSRTKNIMGNKNFLKFITDKKEVFNFLKLLQESGLTNMLGAGAFLTYTSDNLKDYIRGQFKDVDDYEDLIEAADNSRNALIRGLMSMYEKEGSDISDLDKVNKDFKHLVKQAMSLYIGNYQDFIKNS